ncbi:PREDICTED: uncharacterized protein LOC104719754 [Camelina sativa]|uniref:Uncharacterized protein LOC104719754 n=1 Tax=Camelina sativa TaxID=90675 RepID=A0ABM1QHW9_CAMSA|nr:PREDICTED: uncharacterized protein LOC104719754 [Camelina sativa]
MAGKGEFSSGGYSNDGGYYWLSSSEISMGVVKMIPFLNHINGYNLILKMISTALMAILLHHLEILQNVVSLQRNFLGFITLYSEKRSLEYRFRILAPRRKKLGELFRDSIREGREEIFEESSKNQSEKGKKSSSDHSDELKIIENSVKEKKNLKSLNYHHRCLPRFSSFKGSLMEKKKKKKKKIHVK